MRRRGAAAPERGTALPRREIALAVKLTSSAPGCMVAPSPPPVAAEFSTVASWHGDWTAIQQRKGGRRMKALILWIAGVPLSVIILLYVFGVLH